MKTHGYSGKPLIQKLGFKPDSAICAIHAPAHYMELLGPEHETLKWISQPDQADAIHLFVNKRAALEDQLPSLVASLQHGAMLWVSWPKKSSKLFQDLTEDGIRAVALPLGVVDIKVCAVDEDWSGLKLVWRR